MELLYVWIEDYKNIKEQGFNFSSKHYLEFTSLKDETGKIIGGELKYQHRDYIENFFNNSITNITAIIGGNGSGKSSVLDFIDNYVFAWHAKKNLLLAFSVNDKIKIIYDDKLEISYNTQKIEPNPYEAYEGFNTENNISHVLGEDINAIYYYNYYRHVPSKFSGNTVTSYIDNDTLSYVEDEQGQTALPLLPEDIYIQDISNQIRLYAYLEDIRNILEFIPKILRMDISFWLEKDDIKNQSPLIQYVFDFYIKNAFSFDGEDFLLSAYFLILKSSESKLTQHLKQKFLTIATKDSFYKAFDSFFQFLQITETINAIENIVKSSSFKSQSYVFFNPKDSVRDIFILLNSLELGEQLRFYWHGLSTGELAYFNILARIYSTIDTVNAKSIILFIDEGELGFHPQWQKKYLKTLIDFLPKIFKEKKIQIILTSHSPFLVSDLPKENIIFLEKDKEGKCKVSQLQNHEETFGANIHTLFSDAFFMDKGLMGDFAKQKIKEVLIFLKQIDPDKNDKIITEKEALFIISQVGEPLLKKKLEKLYGDNINKYQFLTTENLEDQENKLKQELDKIKKEKQNRTK